MYGNGNGILFLNIMVMVIDSLLNEIIKYYHYLRKLNTIIT